MVIKLNLPFLTEKEEQILSRTEFFNRILRCIIQSSNLTGFIMAKGKKLSLEEARNLFSDKTPSRSKPARQNRKRAAPQGDRYVSQKISQLERKIMEGDLSPDEEKKVMQEIEQLEKKMH